MNLFTVHMQIQSMFTYKYNYGAAYRQNNSSALENHFSALDFDWSLSLVCKLDQIWDILNIISCI